MDSMTPEQARRIRDVATRESHPYTDPRADYDWAKNYRQATAQGAARRAA
jgi:hypothetical protein